MKLFTEDDVKDIANKMYGRGVRRAMEIMCQELEGIDKLSAESVLRSYLLSYGENTIEGFDSLGPISV